MDGTIQNLATEGRGVLIVARRLDTMQSGSSQYIYGYLKLCRDAGLSTTTVPLWLPPPPSNPPPPALPPTLACVV